MLLGLICCRFFLLHCFCGFRQHRYLYVVPLWILLRIHLWIVAGHCPVPFLRCRQRSFFNVREACRALGGAWPIPRPDRALPPESSKARAFASGVILTELFKAYKGVFWRLVCVHLAAIYKRTFMKHGRRNQASR